MNLTVFVLTFINPTAEEGREIWGVYKNKNAADMGVNNLYTECGNDSDFSEFIDEWQVEIREYPVHDELLRCITIK
jgi:hypothetical protein